MSNQVQSNELILWLLGAAVVLVLGLIVAEYLTRRVRYMWKLRRTHEQVLPRFNPNSEVAQRQSAQGFGG